MTKKNIFIQKGAILLEAIVSLAVLIVILSAMSVVIIVAVNNSAYIKNQNLANKYAGEGMEYIRYTRENNYTVFQGFKTNPGTYCMKDDNSIVPVAIGGVCTVNVSGNYIREIEFENNSNDCKPGVQATQLKATVTVWWAGTKCPDTSTKGRYCHKSQLVSCFADKENIGL